VLVEKLTVAAKLPADAKYFDPAMTGLKTTNKEAADTLELAKTAAEKDALDPDRKAWWNLARCTAQIKFGEARGRYLDLRFKSKELNAELTADKLTARDEHDRIRELYQDARRLNDSQVNAKFKYKETWKGELSYLIGREYYLTCETYEITDPQKARFETMEAQKEFAVALGQLKEKNDNFSVAMRKIIQGYQGELTTLLARSSSPSSLATAAIPERIHAGWRAGSNDRTSSDCPRSRCRRRHAVCRRARDRDA
jgi:hypothetical protein